MLRVKNKLAVKFSSNEEGILNSYGDMEYKFHKEDISLPEKEQEHFLLSLLSKITEKKIKLFMSQFLPNG